MKKPTPHLEALIGAELNRVERDRLRRAHEALLHAGPLPKLPPSLQQPPAVTLRQLPTRLTARPRRRYLATAAAALTLIAGSAIPGLSGSTRETVRRSMTMNATPAAPHATATLTIGSRDQAGNSPITLRVSGLPRLPVGRYYEMYLTRQGRLVASCGTFRTDGDATVIHLTDPYPVGEYNGWIITHAGTHQHQPLLTTNT